MIDETMVQLTTALLNRGLDFEVTLRDSKSTVRLFDSMTNATIGTDTKETIEEAMASVLANVACNAPQFKDGKEPFDGLSRL